jgi:hypothetical protein
MLSKFKCGGTIRLSDKAYVIRDEPHDVELFLDLLQSSSRQLPVVFVTPWATGEYVADYKSIASELAGLAYVVVAQDPNATRLLDDRLPKQLNCFDGGVRIYWPEFSVSQAASTLAVVAHSAFQHEASDPICERTVEADFRRRGSLL